MSRWDTFPTAVAKLRLEDGDTLVVTVPDYRTKEEYEEFVRHVREQVSEGIRVIVRTRNVDMAVIHDTNERSI